MNNYLKAYSILRFLIVLLQVRTPLIKEFKLTVTQQHTQCDPIYEEVQNYGYLWIMIHSLKFVDCSMYVEVVMEIQLTEVDKIRNNLIQQTIPEIIVGIKIQ